MSVGNAAQMPIPRITITYATRDETRSQASKAKTSSFHDHNATVPYIDPKNPILWTTRKKVFVFSIISGASALTTALGPMVTTSFGQVSNELRASIDTTTLILAGVFAISVGITTFITTALALVYGKRPLYLWSTLTLIPLCLWTWRAKTLVEVTISRLLQGAACAPFETLVSASVVDLFPVHQRATYLSIWGLASGISLAFSQVGGAIVVEKLGWRALFLIAGPTFAVVFICIYFLVPETAYVKPLISHPLEQQIRARVRRSRWRHEEKRFTEVPLWRLTLNPLILFAYPAVLYGSIVNGLNMTWIIGFALSSVQIFAAPPYNLGPIGVGLTSLPAVVGFCVSQPVAGIATDWLLRKLAARNRGVMEPEFRLPGMLVATVLATIGFLGFGQVVIRGQLALALFFFAVLAASLPWTNSVALTYVIDSHEQLANEAFVALGLAKSILLLVIASAINGAIQKHGVVIVMEFMALINLVVNLLTVPMWFYGKRWREHASRSRIARLVLPATAETSGIRVLSSST
ncbi:hypothetical protein PYCC9005_001229 [Savitreella phatthalungensis]